jgi:peptidoglycan hydrolase-like protein with peptidoglycan-binding domain
MKWFSIVAWMLLACLPPAFGSRHPHRKPASHHSNVKHSRHVKRPRRSKHSQDARSQGAFRTASFHAAALPEPDVQSSRSSTKSKPGAKKKSRKKKTARRAPSQTIPTPDRISEIQSALSRGGYYSGDPTGKIDANTVDALQHFQSANGLDSTGKLDALTLQKLGLGSDVAGVSAPKGIVSHSCCSMTPSPSLAPPAPPAGTAPAPTDSPKPKPSSATDPASANSSALNSATR